MNSKSAEIDNFLKLWYQSGVYSFNRNKNDMSDVFFCDTPPPTISGQYHMGHAYSYCHQDFIARFKRMAGYNVLNPFGIDNNGIPTEKLWEKQHKKIARNIKGDDVVNFLSDCQSMSKKYFDGFEKFFKSLHMSYDFDYSYSTLSKKSSLISQLSFIDLFNKGLIYQSSEPVYWDVHYKTSVAITDIEEKPMEKNQYVVKFKHSSGMDIPIMTTRPELLKSCACVLFNPKDERYNGMSKKQSVTYDFGTIDIPKIEFGNSKTCSYDHCITPIFNQKVPLIPDEDVLMDFGTGLVMCCTYGDWQDVVWTRRHKVESNNWIDAGHPSKKIIILADGTIEEENLKNETNSPKAKHSIESARSIIELSLSNANCIISKTKSISSVKVGERSGKPIEIINSNQFYVDFGFKPDSAVKKDGYPTYSDFKDDFLQFQKSITFYPEHMRNKLTQWVEGLSQDWCISRNRVLGVKIPVNINKDGSFDVIEQSKLPAMVEDAVNDDFLVFDTWFTSSLSTSLTTGNLSNELSVEESVYDLYQSGVRSQSHEIIRNWTFLSIVKSMMHHSKRDEKTKKIILLNSFSDKTPWTNVMISGWCLAEDKSKMSKSKNNVVVPDVIINQHGGDSIRYWSSCGKHGVDMTITDTKIKDAVRLIKKINNVQKFISSNVNNEIINEFLSKNESDVVLENVTCDTDIFAIQALQSLINSMTSSFNKFDYTSAKDNWVDYFWNIFCDNYIEMIKSRIFGLDAFIYKKEEFSKILKDDIIKGQRSAQFASLYILSNLLKLICPIIPYTSENSYHKLLGLNFDNLSQTSICKRGSWPKTIHLNENRKINEHGSNAIEFISFVRKYKSDNQLPLNANISKITTNIEIIDGMMFDVMSCSGCYNIQHSKSEQENVHFVKCE